MAADEKCNIEEGLVVHDDRMDCFEIRYLLATAVIRAGRFSQKDNSSLKFNTKQTLCRKQHPLQNETLATANDGSRHVRAFQCWPKDVFGCSTVLEGTCDCEHLKCNCSDYPNNQKLR